MSTTPTIPVFKLYGETHHWPTPDLLHCESIPERSALHNWHIHPLRHADLVHLLHVARGRVELELEGSVHPLEGPLVIVVPSMSIHGFPFSPKTKGKTITLPLPSVKHWVKKSRAPRCHQPAFHRLTS